MKTIIAGDRNFTDYELLKREVNEFDKQCCITEVVSGKANGADWLGEKWAKEYNIPIKEFPAEWNKYGKAAGPIRNTQMAKYAHALIAFLAPNSRGTKNMIEQATKYGLIVKVVNVVIPVITTKPKVYIGL